VTDLANYKVKGLFKGVTSPMVSVHLYEVHVVELMSGWNSFRMPLLLHVLAMVLITDQWSRLYLLRILYEITAPSKR
jgi:hypothetical protein